MRSKPAGRHASRRGKVTAGTFLSAAAAATGLVLAGVPGLHGAAGISGAPASNTRPLVVTTIPSPATTQPPAPTTTTTAPPAAQQTSAPRPTTPPPPPAPTTTTTATPAPQVSVRRGIIPPSEPPANIPPSPDFLQSCKGTQYDDSTSCVNTTLAAIDNARTAEGLPAMGLPSNWYSLTVEQQLFVITNLERTVRGLPALSAMADALDQAAAQGAAQNTDPSPPSGFPFTQWGSNWAGAVGNPLEAMYYWMYDDGLGSSNIECTQSDQSGCWGHRQNVLLALSCQMCVMGTGYDATAWNGDPSMAELLVDSSGQPAVEFTWAQEQPYL